MPVLSLPELPGILTAEKEALIRYAEAGIAENTRLAYASSWRSWQAWIQRRGGLDLDGRGGLQVEAIQDPRVEAPAPVQVEALLIAELELFPVWLAELADSGRSYSTIARHVAAISTIYRSKNLTPPGENPVTRAILRGIRRKIGVAVRRAPALFLQELIAGLPREGGGAKTLRDRALLLIGWIGALRRSEIVGLDIEDLEENPRGLILHLRRSKTDQDGTGRTVIIPAGRGKLCPVVALKSWIAALHDSTGPIFRAVNRHGTIKAGRLEARAVARIVREAATKSGLTGNYSGHSLRSGFISEAALRGRSERSIAAQTGHRSIVILRGYVRRATPFDDNAAADILI